MLAPTVETGSCKHGSSIEARLASRAWGETPCGHAFHGACWSAYVLSKTPSIDSGLDNGHLLAAAYLNAFAGPPCPLCRAQFPMIHSMALRLADKKSAKVDRDVARFDVDTSLFIASRAW